MSRRQERHTPLETQRSRVPMSLDASLIYRNTASSKGRHISITPRPGALQRLQYGRILLDSDVPRVAFETSGREVGLICLSGSCTVRLGDAAYELGRYDSLYVPRGRLVEITTQATVDLVDFEAEVDGEYPVQLVRYA